MRSYIDAGAVVTGIDVVVGEGRRGIGVEGAAGGADGVTRPGVGVTIFATIVFVVRQVAAARSAAAARMGRANDSLLMRAERAYRRYF